MFSTFKFFFTVYLLLETQRCRHDEGSHRVCNVFPYQQLLISRRYYTDVNNLKFQQMDARSILWKDERLLSIKKKRKKKKMDSSTNRTHGYWHN